jgi:SAM-dependent methyltransferase
LTKTVYDEAFYRRQSGGSLESAERVIPFLLETFPGIGSAVDIGCGVGTWLSVFKKHGAAVTGVDGNDMASRHIADADFTKADLAQRVSLSGRFDIALSLEVAEHLDPGRADTFVQDLCALSDLVVFGAAVPLQSGKHHVNCQWPGFWSDLFERHGYATFDIIRPSFWDDDRVAWWYQQNTLVYVRRSCGSRHAQAEEALRRVQFPRNLVHPRCYEHYHVRRHQPRVLVDSLKAALAKLGRR